MIGLAWMVIGAALALSLEQVFSGAATLPLAVPCVGAGLLAGLYLWDRVGPADLLGDEDQFDPTDWRSWT